MNDCLKSYQWNLALCTNIMFLMYFIIYVHTKRQTATIGCIGCSFYICLKHEIRLETSQDNVQVIYEGI